MKPPDSVVYPHLSEQDIRSAIVWALEHDEEFNTFEEGHRDRLDALATELGQTGEEIDT